jgi:hypothetical protein
MSIVNDKTTENLRQTVLATKALLDWWQYRFGQCNESAPSFESCKAKMLEAKKAHEAAVEALAAHLKGT